MENDDIIAHVQSTDSNYTIAALFATTTIASTICAYTTDPRPLMIALKQTIKWKEMGQQCSTNATDTYNKLYAQIPSLTKNSFKELHCETLLDVLGYFCKYCEDNQCFAIDVVSSLEATIMKIENLIDAYSTNHGCIGGGSISENLEFTPKTEGRYVRLAYDAFPEEPYCYPQTMLTNAEYDECDYDGPDDY